MKARDALIAWTPNTAWAQQKETTAGQVKIGHLIGEDDQDWTSPYAFTGGASYTERRNPKSEDLGIMLMFIEFHTLVVRDRIDPQVAHTEFLKIDEYRERISPDIQGADI